MPTCTLYLIRHGESVSNRDRIVSGQFDSPLSDTGREQARELRQTLSGVHFDDVYSSDLLRATETAEIVMGRPVPVLHQLTGLRERTFGALEGKPKADLEAMYVNFPQDLTPEQRWVRNDRPDMESNAELATRFLATLRQVAQENMGRTLLISTHGGGIRVSLIQLGAVTDQEVPPGSFQNCGYVELTFDGHEFAVRQIVGIDRSKAAKRVE